MNVCESKGRENRRVKMQIQGDEILSIVGDPIKCLGKWFNESLTDKESMEDTKKELRTVDDSGLLDSTRHGFTRLLESTRHGFTTLTTSMGPDHD